jgi:hypothetical protein
MISRKDSRKLHRQHSTAHLSLCVQCVRADFFPGQNGEKSGAERLTQNRFFSVFIFALTATTENYVKKMFYHCYDAQIYLPSFPTYLASAVKYKYTHSF